VHPQELFNCGKTTLLAGVVVPLDYQHKGEVRSFIIIISLHVLVVDLFVLELCVRFFFFFSLLRRWVRLLLPLHCSDASVGSHLRLCRRLQTVPVE
jgi:hypothetical protein